MRSHHESIVIEKPASSKILRAIVALLAWAVFALFIAEHAEAGQWEDCAEAHGETCQGSGCFNDRGQDVFQACGAPPLATGADKYRILADVAETCAAHGTTDFDLIVKKGFGGFDKQLRGDLWFVSAKDARAACAGK